MNRWALFAGIFVAFQICCVAMLALVLGFQEPPPFGKYFATATIPVLLFLIVFPIWNLRGLRALPDSPTQLILSLDWSPLPKFAFAMALMWLQFVALTWAKAMIPVMSPMWADIPLANVEAAILTRDAWLLLPAPTPWLETLYFLWPLAICVGFVVAYFQKRETALLAFFLCVGLLGVFGQFLLPSGGPIFFERLGFGDRFAAMPIPGKTMAVSDMLWTAYSSRSLEFAVGISAFPSIHVATTAWMAFALRHWMAYAYLVVIFFGSIMLGWHYALDGVAGIVGASICFAIAKAALAPRERGGRNRETAPVIPRNA